jgi:tetratricopeptide (TPR) repeat protein
MGAAPVSQQKGSGLNRYPKMILSILAMTLGFGIAAHAASAAPCGEGAGSEEWRAVCDRAIEQETDPKRRAALRFGRAYVAVEQYNYNEALTDLNAAITADPDNPLYLHERAYVYGELSEYVAAIADLDRQIELQPKEPTAYRERAYARHFSGNLQGAYEDRARELELLPDSIEAILNRAEAAAWLGRFDDARTDAKRANARAIAAGDTDGIKKAEEYLESLARQEETSPGKDPGKRCDVSKGLDSSGPRTLIGDCTRAFLDAKDGAAKAEALTSRSLAWKILASSQGHSTEDLRIAVAFDPKDPNRYTNLGFAYLSTSHSWAAKREFERALAIERTWLALAGRAAARANLNDPEGALADALASMEIKPNEAATWVLANHAFDCGEKDNARKLYLIIYSMGSRDERLIDRLKELGVTDPAQAVKDET